MDFKTDARTRQRNQAYKDANREEVRMKNAAYMRERRATSTDRQFQLRDKQRRLFAQLLSPQTRFTPAILEMSSWTGLPPAKLREHIAAQFKPEWGWHNHGTAWVIDHINPLVNFDLTDAEQCRQAWYYTNLQPLDKLENTLKGAN